MGDPVVLPKFELPGDRPHWAVKLAWISGIVLEVSVIGLGAVVMHHRRLEMEAHVAREEAIARVKAEAEAKVAAAVAVAKAKREAELAEKRAIAERAAAEQAAKAAAKAAELAAADANDPAKASRSGHRTHSGHGTKSTKVAMSKAGPGVNAASSTGGMKDLSTGGKSKAAAGKPDPIDELMRKMK